MTFETEQSHGGRCANAVLPGARLGYDTFFVHAFRKQTLTQGVIDLVRARMRQVLALKIDLRAAEPFAQAPRVADRRWPSSVGALQIGKLLVKRWICNRSSVSRLQLVKRWNDRLRHEAPAEFTKISALIRQVSEVRAYIWFSHVRASSVDSNV